MLRIISEIASFVFERANFARIVLQQSDRSRNISIRGTDTVTIDAAGGNIANAAYEGCLNQEQLP